ncbi:protein CASPARIAN STRIP INTEGRITY FACTOR 2-like [Phragmites australis]|uniref:protein CASPARIAN STRIP INTEGRITY FACTOR 2-like n=1 Tax=Phragmites australis TaxID=29695 RepID=UPI002D78DD7D|nr:protein CASPARIAN STRIP INTEGRITY FACTOR 2-like [Phragmites australis]
MSSKKVDRASVLVLLLIVVSAFSVCAAGGRELAHEKMHKEHSSAASVKGATASGDMVKTNDYGRYDPAPAFSKPRFKLIPN